jgi:hypothetical protein
LVEYRREAKWTRLRQEKWLIEQFQKAARPLTPTPPENTWEWLALGQHHGLATRLLDWTTNSLGALYFACEDQHSTADSAVWCYHHEGAMANPAADPFSLRELAFYWPPHVTQRITVQGGCFTTHPPTSAQKTLKWPGDLRKVVIPAASRHRIRRELVQLGITRATLFPDLDGIAVTINRGVAADQPLRASVRRPRG